MKFWVNTVSRSHVERGVEGGFTQANHGSPTILKRLARGDRVVFYAPRTDYPRGEPLQKFVALGEIHRRCAVSGRNDARVPPLAP